MPPVIVASISDVTCSILVMLRYYSISRLVVIVVVSACLLVLCEYLKFLIKLNSQLLFDLI